MATLIIAQDIPGGINTLEKSLAWNILVSQQLFGKNTYQELQGGLLEKEIDASVVRAADDTFRLIFRGALRLDPTYVTGGGKLWSYAMPWGEVAIPAAFKSN
ncbi:hypothetical protein [Pseudanabaena sp. FACHB-2040]|uniref:hypothetical protein n=1 Tax=Pseudanabaena sp. FACHB-2040 TaxID=2692859 RepID=UPI001685886D|nr:hypothetical protein [Pseudanabaena sp. FACHB-2040]MBD2259908.1 hypothetical protein [Pseudanabaena sp. FACHB-2040]